MYRRLVLLILSLGLSGGISRGADLAYRFNLWNETAYNQVNRSSPLNPDNLWLTLPEWTNSLVFSGEASYSFKSRVKVAGGLANRFDYVKGASDRLRVKELYVNWSVNSHWDITAGKKILKWGTGYAWTPTGVLDPPRDPRDPTDRLNLYQGRELLEARGTYGNHNFSAVFASPAIYSKLRTSRTGNQWAFKYNSLIRGFDYSLIGSFGGLGSPNRFGANATYVIGQSLELHGEFLAQRGSRLLYPLASAEADPRITYSAPPFGYLKEHDPDLYFKALAGLNYTFVTGWNVVMEFYRDSEGLSGMESNRQISFITYNEELHALQAGPDPSRITLPAANLLWSLQQYNRMIPAKDYFFARVSRSRMRQKWDVEGITLVNLRDGGSTWIPQVSYDFSQRFGAYMRYNYYAGSRYSETGLLPVRSSWIAGLAFRY
jgi:hypothetical protein